MGGLLGMGINWTQVLVTGVPATIAAVCSGAALVIVALNRRALGTPSGTRVGSLTERTHHLAEVSALRAGRIDKKLNGETPYDEEMPDA